MEIGVLLVGWGWTIEQTRAGWAALEELGYDICYIGDDLFPHPNVDDSVWEPWALLPAIAATTERIKIGSLVSPADRRHPGLFAKTTSTVDRISGGRLIVGRGLGNAPEQQVSLDQRYPPPAERAEILREELEILRSMWTQPRTTFEGRYYTVRDAINEPKPASRPHPDILVAYGSKRFMPRVAAEYAQRVNLVCTDERAAENIALLAELCEERGRDISEIVVGRPASITFTERPIGENEREPFIRGLARELRADPSYLLAEYERHLSYIGPASECAEALLPRTAGLGVRELVVYAETIGMNSYERMMAGLRTFAAEVMPALKGA